MDKEKPGFSFEKIGAKNFIITKKESISKLPLKGILRLTLVILFLNFIISVACQSILPPEIPLFYSLALGEDQITTSLGLTIPSLVALGICLVNILLALILGDNFLKQILLISCLAVAILSIIAVIEIILLVGSF